MMNNTERIINPLQNFELQFNSYSYEYSTISHGTDVFVELQHTQLPFSLNTKTVFAPEKYNNYSDLFKCVSEIYKQFLMVFIYSKAQEYKDDNRTYYAGEYDKELNAWFILKDGQRVYETFE